MKRKGPQLRTTARAEKSPGGGSVTVPKNPLAAVQTTSRQYEKRSGTEQRPWTGLRHVHRRDHPPARDCVDLFLHCRPCRLNCCPRLPRAAVLEGPPIG